VIGCPTKEVRVATKPMSKAGKKATAAKAKRATTDLKEALVDKALKKRLKTRSRYWTATASDYLAGGYASARQGGLSGCLHAASGATYARYPAHSARAP
jgi:hypothetical protein